MSNLIKAELFKLNRNKSFWVILASVTGLSALLHVLIITDWWMMNNTAFDFSGLSQMNALATFTVPLFFNLIVSALAGFFVSIEFSNGGAVKNQVISGNKRSVIFLAKYVVYSMGSYIVTVLIPLFTAIIVVIAFGQGDIFSSSNLMFLVKAYGLFTVQFLGYTAMMMIFAIVTEDSGKTIILSIMLTIAMFVIEKFNVPSIIKYAYEHSIFQQFTDVFKTSLTNGEIVKSVLIGFLTIIIVNVCGVIIFNRKEIK